MDKIRRRDRQLRRFVGYSSRAPNGCWLWNASTREGYGQYLSDYAHRWIWKFLYGTIPTKAVIMHVCDNRLCVNPDHLKLGTQADNIRDAVSKGRIANGERQGLSKLTEIQVLEIRALYKTGQYTQPQLAKAYGLCQATVYELLRYKTWRHVK